MAFEAAAHKEEVRQEDPSFWGSYLDQVVDGVNDNAPGTLKHIDINP